MEFRIKNKRRNSLNEQRESGQEKMKKQLTELGMYDEGMTFKEMKDTLTVVDNSKLSVEENSIKISPLLNSSEAFRSIQSPLSSMDNYVNKQIKGDNSNSDSTISDQSNELHHLSPKGETKINLCQNEMDEKSLSCHRSVDPLKKSELKFPDLKNSQELKTFENAYCMENNRCLNLLNCKKVDNDIPLKLKCLPSIRQKFAMIDRTSHIFNATLNQQCATLNKIAMMWHNFNTNLESYEIQWGSPIKVETANGSLDKKPYLSPDNDQEVLELHDLKKVPSHTGLRPRLGPKNSNGFFIDDDDNNNSNIDDNDDDDDNDYDDDVETIFQKRKKLSTSIQKPPIKKRSTIKTKKKQSNETSIEVENHIASKNIMYSKIQLLNPRKRAAKSPTPEYPELCIAKKNIVLSPTTSLLNSTEATLNNCQLIKQNINNVPKNLSSNEIESMITDDEDEEVIPNSQEPEKCTDRLNRSSKLLRQYKFHDDKIRHDKEAEEWQKLCIKNKELENENRLRRRIKEEKSISLKLKEEEKKEQKQKNKYRNVTMRASNLRSTGNELNAEGFQSKYPSDINADDESLMMGKEEVISDEDNSTGYPNKGVQCPLCNKYFTHNKIESHADECASFSDNIQQQSSQSKENTEMGSVFSPALLTCQSCEQFSTSDSQAFEQHCSYECEENFNNQGTENNRNATMSVVGQSTLSTSDQLSRKRKR